MAKSKQRRKTLIFSIIGLALVALTVGAIVNKREVVITIQTESVARRNLTEIVVANGKIQPVVQVKISPEVSGEIIDLPVKEGQAVKKGDMILKIKPDFYIANRNQAEASYKSSVASKATGEANLKKAAAEFRRNQDPFKDRKFAGTVTEIANSSSSSGLPGASSGNQQEATKFGVKIRIKEKEAFRPGMSVTAEIETRSRTNVLAVPIASVTTRLPKETNKLDQAKAGSGSAHTNSAATRTNSTSQKTNALIAESTNTTKSDKKSKEP